MKKYKKINKIIQVLPVIFFILIIFYLGNFKLVLYSSASEHSTGERGTGPDEIKKQEEMKMSEKGKLSKEEGEYLLSLARKTIEARLFARDSQPDKDQENEKYHEKRGTFVTLTINDNLRGCIGHIIPQESLKEGIRINAINAAFQDPRFPPLSREEWKHVRVEISILTEPLLLKYSDADDLLRKLRPGIDGVIIKKGYQDATFLPQVWDQLPDKEQFLRHLCMKAGLSGSEWKKGDLTVYTYQVQAFEEEH